MLRLKRFGIIARISNNVLFSASLSQIYIKLLPPEKSKIITVGTYTLNNIFEIKTLLACGRSGRICICGSPHNKYERRRK